MSKYVSSKRKNTKSAICRPSQQEINDVPNQFCDYIASVSNRFEDICNLYLKGLSMDDVRYLQPQDFINLVPQEQYKHKLLMTILVRRYLFRDDDKLIIDSDNCDNESYDEFSHESSESCPSSKK